MADFETFSTTADVGIRIKGDSYKSLYQNAVKGLNLLYFGQPLEISTATTHIQSFEFNGDSCENILVNLLSEVVFLLQNKFLLTIDIYIKKAEETYLQADLITIVSNQQPDMEIKSVTYHNLEVKDQDGTKSTEIVFDI
jgi:SHS2 domain-containing protein